MAEEFRHSLSARVEYYTVPLLDTIITKGGSSKRIGANYSFDGLSLSLSLSQFLPSRGQVDNGVTNSSAGLVLQASTWRALSH